VAGGEGHRPRGGDGMSTQQRTRAAVCLIWVAGVCQGGLVMATLFVSLGVAVVYTISALNLVSMLLAGGLVEDAGNGAVPKRTAPEEPQPESCPGPYRTSEMSLAQLVDGMNPRRRHFFVRLLCTFRRCDHEPLSLTEETVTVSYADQRIDVYASPFQELPNADPNIAPLVALLALAAEDAVVAGLRKARELKRISRHGDELELFDVGDAGGEANV